jgi:hypothetical protein
MTDNDLTTTQLDAIQRLLAEPLRLAVRAEMQAGHERLAAAIEKLGDQLSTHIADSLRIERSRESRLVSIENRVAALEKFRGKVLIVYAALTLMLSCSWTLVREWIAGLARRR